MPRIKKTDQETSLYDDLISKDIEIDNHESDLQFPVSVETTKLLKKHPLQHKNSTTFINGSQVWYEVPFAYDPWWKKRDRG